MGILETWTLVNVILKLNNVVDFTWIEATKPLWLGTPIVFIILLIIKVICDER